MTTEAVRRAAVPFAVALLVLAVVLGVMRLVDPPGVAPGGSGAGSGGDPEVLRLSSWTPAVDGEPDPRYILDADLPEGPDALPVHRLVAADDVPSGLLSALRLEGPGDEMAGVRRWVEGARQLELQSRSGGQWTYLTVEAASSDKPQTDQARARELARTVLEGAGLDPDDAQEVASGSAGQLSVDPRVGDLPTSGFTTSVDVVGADVVSAQGWLADTQAGPSYPLVSAKEAWDALVRTPLPMTLMACPEPMPGGQDPVTCGGPVTVTGAELGLSLQWAGPEPILVPSWLFEVKGSPLPLAQVAVQPRLLELADDVPPPAPGGGGGGVPGSTGTAAPPVAPSVDPGPDQPMSRFTSVTRGADDRSLDVQFWGGVEDCYRYTVRADEGSEAVRLSLTEKSTFDGACIDLAQQYDRTVRLGKPLGVRRVVDAATGETLLGPTR